MKLEFESYFWPYDHHPSFQIQFEQILLKKFLDFKLNCKWEKLEFQIYRIGEEKVVVQRSSCKIFIQFGQFHPFFFTFGQISP